MSKSWEELLANRVHGIAHAAKRKPGWKSRCDNGHNGNGGNRHNGEKKHKPVMRQEHRHHNAGPQKSMW